MPCIWAPSNMFKVFLCNTWDFKSATVNSEQLTHCLNSNRNNTPHNKLLTQTEQTVNLNIVQWTFMEYCKCCEINTRSPSTPGKSNAGHSKGNKKCHYTYSKHCNWKELTNPWKHGVFALREGTCRDSNFWQMLSYLENNSFFCKT